MVNKRAYRTIILTAILVVTIYHTQAISMTIIFSGLCAMLVHPLVKKLEKIGLNLVASSLIVVVVTAVVLTGLFGLIAYQGSEIIASLPTEKMETVVDNPIGALDEKVDANLRAYPEQIDALLKKSKSAIGSFAISAISMTNATITFLISCPIFIFFMLISRRQIRSFYYSSFKRKKRAIANRILQQIEMVYISYIRGLFYVMLVVAVLTGAGLFALGIDYAIFLGMLAGLLTLIPYVGVFLSALIPVMVAILTKDSLWYTAGVIGVFALVQFLEGNIITPKIMGKQVGVNPLVVILSIIIFGAIGGILGMILTIPVLALLKTIAFYIPGWKPFRQLLQA